jgi:hypothetical protein
MNRQLIEEYVTTDEAGPLTEREVEVLCWRLEQLERVGFSGELAYAIAEDNTIDLHGACDLVTRGCPPATAYRILV